MSIPTHCILVFIVIMFHMPCKNLQSVGHLIILLQSVICTQFYNIQDKKNNFVRIIFVSLIRVILFNNIINILMDHFNKHLRT